MTLRMLKVTAKIYVDVLRDFGENRGTLSKPFTA
jgi:hypothetical protein